MADPRRDDGLTLVELLVVMLLMGILGSMVATTFVVMQRTSRETDALLGAIGEARIASNAMTKTLRTAVRGTSTDPLLRVATDREVRFLSDVKGRTEPELIALVVEGDEIVQLRWQADPGSGPAWTFSGDPVRRSLLANIPTDTVVFTYRDLDRCAVGALDDCEPLATGASGLSPMDRNSVDVVDVVVPATGRGIDPFPLETRVLLRNEAFVPDA